MLVASIFSFSHNDFYFSQHKFQFLSRNYFAVCKCFEFGLFINFYRVVTSKGTRIFHGMSLWQDTVELGSAKPGLLLAAYKSSEHEVAS